MHQQGSRRKFTPFLALIEDEQKAFIDGDGRERYPDLANTGPHGRHINPALRDIISFCQAHYPQFVAWVNHRNK